MLHAMRVEQSEYVSQSSRISHTIVWECSQMRGEWIQCHGHILAVWSMKCYGSISSCHSCPSLVMVHRQTWPLSLGHPTFHSDKPNRPILFIDYC